MKEVGKVTILEDKVRYYNELYRQGTPEITDQEFDELVQELKRTRPGSDWFNKGVQDPQPLSRKEQLPYQMNSLDKCKNLNEIKEWLIDKIGNELWDQVQLIVTPKLDGLSVEKDLITNQAWTRGDGQIGQKCEMHMMTIPGPTYKKDGGRMFVRGEVVFQNKDWDKFSEANPEYKNPRNTATGFINGDYDPKKPYHLLSYLCYDVLSVDWSKSEQLDWITKNTEQVFSLPYLKVTAKELTEKYLESIFFLWADTYPIDGLVIDINESKYRMWCESNGNPAYARAYKHPVFSEKANTIIRSIERNINRHGVVTPVCILEPRQLSGVEVSRVNGINMAYLYDWGLMPDVEITIVRSGEVIPKIVEVECIEIPFKEDFKTDKEYQQKYKEQVSFRQKQLQDTDCKICGEYESFIDENQTCPFCQNPLVWDKTFTNMICQNQDCEEVNIQKLSDFFKICGVEEFKELTFRQLYKEGWKTPEQILHIEYEQLIHLEGWGDRSAQMFIVEMKKLKEQGISLAKYYHASGYFGNLGEKTLQLIIDNIKSDTPKYEELIEIKGIAEITAKNFIEGLAQLVWDLPYPSIKINQIISPKPKQGLLTGTIVVFSKFRDLELSKQLEDKGAIVEDNFTNKTNLLIVKDKSNPTTKMKKAEQQGTAIYTKEELVDKLKTM